MFNVFNTIFFIGLCALQSSIDSQDNYCCTPTYAGKVAIGLLQFLDFVYKQKQLVTLQTGRRCQLNNSPNVAQPKPSMVTKNRRMNEVTDWFPASKISRQITRATHGARRQYPSTQTLWKKDLKIMGKSTLSLEQISKGLHLGPARARHFIMPSPKKFLSGSLVFTYTIAIGQYIGCFSKNEPEFFCKNYKMQAKSIDAILPTDGVVYLMRHVVVLII